jgi:hypothetical protein
MAVELTRRQSASLGIFVKTLRSCAPALAYILTWAKMAIEDVSAAALRLYIAFPVLQIVIGLLSS